MYTWQYLLIEEGEDGKPKLSDREFDIVTIALFDGNTTNNIDIIRVFQPFDIKLDETYQVYHKNSAKDRRVVWGKMENWTPTRLITNCRVNIDIDFSYLKNEN